MCDKSPERLIMHVAALHASYCDMLRLLMAKKIVCVENGGLRWMVISVLRGGGGGWGASSSINQVCQITRLCYMISIYIMRGVH